MFKLNPKYLNRPFRHNFKPAVLALSTAALTLAACGSSSSSTATSLAGSTTSGKITWWASPIAQVGIRASLIHAFEQAYPKIHVTLVTAPTSTDTNRAQLVTEISGGATTPDVYMGDVIWPAQFAVHGLAVPLSKYLSNAYFSQFAPGLVAGASYKGQVYGSPLFEDQGFLYYRMDLLAKANLAVPTTWEQLKSEAAQLQNAGLVKYGYVWQGASYEGLTVNFMEYLTSAGGSVVNSSYTHSTLDSAAAIRALTFMRSLITSGVSPPAVTTMQEPQAMSTFDAGNAAFLRNWDYAWSNSQQPASVPNHK